MRISHKNKSIEQRLKESSDILKKYPERICVYLEKQETCDNIPNIDKNKYLVPNNLNIGQFMYVIRKRISINSEQAIFLFVNNNNIISGTMSILDIYNKHKSDDGFLYITYSGENCFGGSNSKFL